VTREEDLALSENRKQLSVVVLLTSEHLERILSQDSPVVPSYSPSPGFLFVIVSISPDDVLRPVMDG